MSAHALPIRRRIRGLLLLAVPLLPLAGGCRADDSGGGSAADDEPVGPVAPVVLVTARDHAFEAPDTVIAGWTTIRLVNRGPERHHVQLFRVDGSRSSQELLAAMGMWRLPDWLVPVGGPGAAEAEGPHVDAATMLEPGEYVLACRIRSPDGREHFRKGMVRRLTVVPAEEGASPSPEPAADVVLGLQDHEFALDGELRAGRNRIRVENRGAQEHHVAIARLRAGATLADVAGYDPASGTPPPVEMVAGTAGLAPGRSNVIDVVLEPGEYVLLCFVADDDDGRRHLEHGMVRQLTVR